MNSSVRMVALAKGEALDAARAHCREQLANGGAYQRFVQMVELHGGDLAAFDRLLATPVSTRTAVAGVAGFVESIDANAVAQAAFELGAGRAQSSDAIDPLAGVELRVTRGDAVTVGQELAQVATETRPDLLETAAERVRDAVKISPTPPPAIDLMLEEVV